MPDRAKLVVRPATESDLEKILELYAQAEFDAGKVLPLATAKQLFERFADYPDYTLYVAERGGDIVGTFALLVMHNLGHLGAPSAIVEDVAVAPALQGNGIGKAMIQFALGLCRAKGCYKLCCPRTPSANTLTLSINRSDSNATALASGSMSRGSPHDAARRRSTSSCR